MGCDLHSHVEVQYPNGGWHEVTGVMEWAEYEDGPFEDRVYGVYAWLAGVRNYSAVTPLDEPRGLPGDISDGTREDYQDWEPDAHSTSWFLVSELLAVDYEAKVNDRRVARQTSARSWDHGCTGSPEEGVVKTLRDFLGIAYMADLDKLKMMEAEGPVRVVFWFDN